ncbi:MAG: peptidylprolyl isomerase [Nanoarchaeota archaeon]
MRKLLLFLFVLSIITLVSCAGKFPRSNLPLAEFGDRITVEYEVRFANNTVYDRSQDYDVPVSFTIGEREVLPGLEKAVLGMKPGEKKKVLLSPEAAYGLHDLAKVELIPLEEFPNWSRIRIGMLLPARGPEGEEVEGRVIAVSPEGVTVDFNHPLAGESLWLDFIVVEVMKR